jgi:hypothetical protein
MGVSLWGIVDWDYSTMGGRGQDKGNETFFLLWALYIVRGENRVSSFVSGAPGKKYPFGYLHPTVVCGSMKVTK